MNVWQVIAENLQLMAALLRHSPPQPSSLADAHYSLSTFTKGKNCNISNCLKVMIPPNRNVRKIFPLPLYSCLAIFSSIFSQNCRISLLSNTTCSPYGFLEVQNLSVCFTALSSHHPQQGSLYRWVLFHSWSIGGPPAVALVRMQSWFLTAETQNTRGTTWWLGNQLQVCLWVKFSRVHFKSPRPLGEEETVWFVFKIMVGTFRQLALLAARLFVLTASVCCISSLFFVYHWVIPWPGT